MRVTCRGTWKMSIKFFLKCTNNNICGASSEFVSSTIPSWQILTAHAQPFRGARDLVFCLKVPLDSLLVWASSGGSGETARMRRLPWTFAARICDKYQIRWTRPSWFLAMIISEEWFSSELNSCFEWLYYHGDPTANSNYWCAIDC